MLNLSNMQGLQFLSVPVINLFYTINPFAVIPSANIPKIVHIIFICFIVIILYLIQLISHNNHPNDQSSCAY